MENDTITVKRGTSFLSDIIKELPHSCILNKGITGCGGTTVEVLSGRNSIILVPTTNLVINKSEQADIFGLYGKTKNSDLVKYLKNSGYKKIIATYDALPRLVEVIGGDIYSEYFLLVDEYHILFNSYSFRRNVIRYILSEYKKFDKYCFMTATPLKGRKLLTELKDLPLITYDWEGADRVNIDIKDCVFIQKELIKEINKADDYNVHIFVNSINFIKRVVKELDREDYRIICSDKSGNSLKTLNVESINSQVKKINFYTSTAFEGCDIYDEDGYSIVVSDSKISTTILDISTLVVQICGRLRNSRFKDRLLMLINTKNHRYCGNSREEFEDRVKENEVLGKKTHQLFYEGDSVYKKKELRSYTDVAYNSFYVIKEDNELKYDPNLKNVDIENFDIINSIYSTSISVLKEIQNTKEFTVTSFIGKGLDPLTQEISDTIAPIKIYTYEEIEKLVGVVLENHGIKVTKTSIGKYIAPITEKKRRVINGKKITTYTKCYI